MYIAASFLKIQTEKEKIKKLDSLVNQIHFDVMDGNFVQNKTIEFKEMFEISQSLTKAKDIHLMVKDIYKYVDMYKKLNPKYIIFHYEATSEIETVIEYIKKENIKVGIAINPDTDPLFLKPYLDKIDLVLIMSVYPGAGGQEFIDVSDKIEKLYRIRKENNLNYLIEVDGGINDKTIKKVNKADIVVVGSFITDSDNYQNQIKKLEVFYE